MFTIPLRITVVITAPIRFPNNTTCRSRAEEMIDPASIPQLNKHFRLQWEEAQDCYVLLYPEGMVKLNESAGLILSYVDGVKTVATIIAELTERFPQVDSIASDIEEFMATASAQRWVAFS